MSGSVEKYKVVFTVEIYAEDPQDAYLRAREVVDEGPEGADETVAWNVILDDEIVLTD